MWKVDMDPGFIFGAGCRREFGKKLKELGATKAMLVYDAVMGQLGYKDELARLAEAEGVQIVAYETEPGEPASSKIDRAVAFAKENGIDALVGFGGGSSIDTAKMTGKVLANGGRCADYLGYTNTAGNKTFKPVIALPTTAGTGADVNTALACDNEELHMKAFTMHRATLSIIDPEYTIGLPPVITANTGIDVMTHALESVCNTEVMPNWFADMMGEEAIRICFKWLPIAFADGKNLEARSWMSYAASLAGYVIKTRKTTFGHAIANQVSDKYHYPHGVGCSIGFFAVTRYNVKGNAAASRMIARAIGLPFDENSDMEKIGQRIVEIFDDWQRSIGMKTWKEYGLGKDFADLCYEKIIADEKWKIVTPPDFELMRQAMYDAADM